MKFLKGDFSFSDRIFPIRGDTGSFHFVPVMVFVSEKASHILFSDGGVVHYQGGEMPRFRRQSKSLKDQIARFKGPRHGESLHIELEFPGTAGNGNVAAVQEQAARR